MGSRPPLDEEEFRRWRLEADGALEGARVQAAAGVQAVGFTPDEFRAAVAKGNPLARSVAEEGVILLDDGFFEGAVRP